MPQTKTMRPMRANKKVKAALSVPPRDVSEENDEVSAQPSLKTKRVPDVDLHDDIAGVIEEKPEVDPLLSEEETDELAAEEAGLDDEEVDPFGDKWEV